MEAEDEIKPMFDCIECQTRQEMIEQLNMKELEGYLPIWPSHKPLLFDKDDIFIILEYQEPTDPEEKKLIKAELSQLIMDAEFYVATANSELEGMKAYLNANTNWKKASEEQENPIKTVGDKAGYILKLTTEIQAKVDSYKSYLSHLKRLEKISELPEGNPPWIKIEPEPEIPTSVKLGGIFYCGLDTAKKCNKCLKCEIEESE